MAGTVGVVRKTTGAAKVIVVEVLKEKETTGAMLSMMRGLRKSEGRKERSDHQKGTIVHQRTHQRTHQSAEPSGMMMLKVLRTWQGPS